MRLHITLFFLLATVSVVKAQQDSIGSSAADQNSKAKSLGGSQKQDSIQTNPEGLITIQDYKIISYARDTTSLDTTLSIKKEYKYNYLRKDDFEVMPFANIGQPYNTLGRTFSKNSFYPQLGALAKHFNYMEVEDIAYYNVPTPMTELMFKTTLEQGQLLDALLTFNINKRFNASIAYKGFRSTGKYLFSQAQSGNFRTTVNYTTKDNAYSLRGHITAQDIEAEENGGLEDRSQFEGGTSDFQDRFRIDVLYTNANNRVLGRRYYLDHQLRLFNIKKDSLDNNPTSLLIGHEFNYESKLYQFTQTEQTDAFGENAFSVPIDDKARLKTMFNKVSAEFSNNILGNLTGSLSLYNYNYFFNSILVTDSGTIPNQLQGEEIAVGGEYFKSFGPLKLRGDINYNISGVLGGNSFNASVDYELNKHNLLFGSINVSSRMPNFNYLLYQSDYENFNWQNVDNFEKQQIQSISFGFDSNLFGKIQAEYSAIDNLAYFESIATQEQFDNNQETAFVRPFQESSTINHLRVKYFKEFKWRGWALANTVLFQDVTQDVKVLNVPQLVTRNTLYFSTDAFKKAMFLQTGVTFKYFTSYNMNAYNPLLGEFYIQNREEFGGFPMLDFFINAKVRQTRIYLKAEHFNSSFSGPNFYSAPNYPYRDFVIRFGLVWNFFS
ncbi:putative porin [Flagellimonas sp. HMM57]|uniref:putative porin n=1 Tax=unclassified Flagellimonas TaxID=2644544 RepID=UPI0013D101A4|nr:MULTISPECIES: putative porin [unclassified Flagellimonas]UII74857.1 putative porin [Flagellimonas sp. HMM57]